MAIIITDQMYVGFQFREEYNKNSERYDDNIKLGFATYVENNKAFEKRKLTVDGWSRPAILEQITEEDDDWIPNKPRHLQKRRILISELESKYFKNELLSGFKISREVRRYGWNGGNVVWRIEDPRGFELEIQSGNMASILDCATLVNGEIQGNCIWGWDGGRVVLLPENSEPYQEGIKDTKRRNTKPIKPSDINIGDVVEFQNGTIAHYEGEFYAVKSDYSSGYLVKTPSRKVHVYTIKDGCTLYTVSQLKVTSIVERNEHPITLEEAAESINARLRINIYSDNLVGVSTTKLSANDFSFELLPISYDNFVEFLHDLKNVYSDYNMSYQKCPLVAKYPDGYNKIVWPYSKVYINSPDQIDADAIVKHKMVIQRHSVSYKLTSGYYYTNRDHNIPTLSAIAGLDTFILLVNIKGQYFPPRIS